MKFMLSTSVSNFRPYVKNAAAFGLHRLALDRVIGAVTGVRETPFISCYHRVVPDYEAAVEHAIPAMLTSTKMFEKQLEWMDVNFRIVSLGDLDAARNGTFPRKGKPLAAITFDDGYADFFWHAFPILQRKGIPSALFVVTDLVSTRELQAHDELYLLLTEARKYWKSKGRGSAHELEGTITAALGESNPLYGVRHIEFDVFNITRLILEHLSNEQLNKVLCALRQSLIVDSAKFEALHSVTWDMLRTVSAQGVTVGSHTKSHPLLAGEPMERVVSELHESKQCIEAELGSPVRHLAYPDGAFNADVVRAAESVGYESAYTICHHQKPQAHHLTVPRLVLWEKSCVTSSGAFSPDILSCQINGLFGSYRECQRDHLSSC